MMYLIFCQNGSKINNVNILTHGGFNKRNKIQGLLAAVLGQIITTK